MLYNLHIRYLDGKDEVIEVNYLSSYPNNDPILFVECRDHSTRHIELKNVFNYWIRTFDPFPN